MSRSYEQNEVNRLRSRFAQLHADGQKALLPYITAGYPDVGTTLEILKRIDTRRCACVELGIPFSDPIADGPVIQASFSRALDSGFKLDALFDALHDAHGQIHIPLVAMVSYSIVYRRGADAFLKRATEAGIDGLIIPDLAIEEVDDLAAAAQEHDCPLIMIIAPTTGDTRRRRILGVSQPFIYYQSLAGVTGERNRLPADLNDNISRLKHETDKPICVGFGISQPAHVAAVCRSADGAIVGSAIVRRINEAVDRGAGSDEIASQVGSFVDELCSALPF